MLVLKVYLRKILIINELRYSSLFKIVAVFTFTLTYLCAYAQAKMSDAIQFDALEKIIGIIFTLGGIFLGFMQLKMANKMAELEAKFHKAISSVEEKFSTKMEHETEKLETKISLSGKEIEARMATRHDIDNLKTIMRLNGDLANANNEALKEQLKSLRHDK